MGAMINDASVEVLGARYRAATAGAPSHEAIKDVLPPEGEPSTTTKASGGDIWTYG